MTELPARVGRTLDRPGSGAPPPEADIASGDVEIAQLRPELVGLGVRVGRVRVVRSQVPAVNHADPRAELRSDIARVDVAVDQLNGGAGCRQERPVLVSPHDLLRD